MSEVNRRRFIAGLAAAIFVPPSVATGVVAAGFGRHAAPDLAATASDAGSEVALLPPPPRPAQVPLPGRGVLSVLPGSGDMLALTVDDGVNTDVVRLYTQFAKDTGIRLTYFVNGTYPSWTDNARLLQPLVESGQIQLGNHTWSHPDLTTLTRSRIADEIARNDAFLRRTFGIDARPYLRPPYGKHNPSVDAVAADLGYTVTTLWSGSLSDSTVITEDYIVKMAETYFRPQNIVIGHLNHLPVTHVYDRLADIIRDRRLRTVTLNDVFIPPRHTI